MPLFWIGGQQSGGGGGGTVTVAASDASADSRKGADFLCDGTNDEVQIQSAIDNLPGVGGSVILSEGKFSIGTVGITMEQNNTKLLGQGQGVTIIEAASGLGAGILLLSSKSTNTETALVLDNTVRHNLTVTTTTAADAAGISKGDICLVFDDTDVGGTADRRRGEIIIAKNDGVGATGVIDLETAISQTYNNSAELILLTPFWEGLTIQAITFQTAQVGITPTVEIAQIEFQYVRNLLVKDCQFKKLWRADLGITQCINAKVIDCDFQGVQMNVDTLKYGVVVFAGMGCLVDGCSFDGMGDMRHAFTQGTLDDDPRTGWCWDIIVSNCWAQGTTEAAFDTHESGKQVLFQGLKIHTAQLNHGIAMRCTYATIADCMIQNCPGDGIRLFNDFLSAIIIRDCYIYRCGANGINITGKCEFLSINGCHFHSNLGTSIVSTDTNSTEYLIHANFYIGNATDAPALTAGTDFTESDNKTRTA